MRKTQTSFIAAVLLCLIAASCSISTAQDDIEISAEVRYRGELDHKTFDLDDGTNDFNLLRTRLRLDLKPGARTRAVVVLQDSRAFGNPESGATAGDDNLGIHEAHFVIERFIWDWLNLRAGRVELDFGNGRLIGAGWWGNGGRSFDAVHLWLSRPSIILNYLFAVRVERFERDQTDASTSILYARFPKAQADLFLIYDYDGRIFAGERLLGRLTAGTYSAREFGGGWDYISNLAFQFGAYLEYDIAAWLATLEIGRILNEEKNYRAALGADLASGDDPDRDDWGVFDNLYYTGHKSRGYMDLFVPSKVEGLFDFYLRQTASPWDKVTIGGDLHYFRTHREYTSGYTGNETNSVGAELDLYLRTVRIENATVEIGGAVFLPSEDWQGPDADPALWGYTMITVRLP